MRRRLQLLANELSRSRIVVVAATLVASILLGAGVVAEFQNPGLLPGALTSVTPGPDPPLVAFGPPAPVDHVHAKPGPVAHPSEPSPKKERGGHHARHHEDRDDD